MGKALFAKEPPKLLLRLPALMVMGGIWFLSSQSILPQPKGILGFDKLQHLLAYAVLAFTVGLWFPGERRARPSPLFSLLSVIVSSLYGAIDEAHQYFVPGRDCNVWDWIADILGALLGTVLLWGFSRLLIHRPHGASQRVPGAEKA